MMKTSVYCAALCVLAILHASLATDSHVTANGTSGATCSTNADCGSSLRVCSAGQCMHKTLFPMAGADILASILVFSAVAVASAGGIGGGGLLVPIFTLVERLQAQEAVPLSKAAIFGAAVGNALVNLRTKHPSDPSRPIIDFDTVVMLEPMTLAGTVVGVYFNKMFPDWLITILLLAVLLKTSHRTLLKARKSWAREASADAERVKEIVHFWRILTRSSSSCVALSSRASESDLIVAFRVLQKWRKFVQKRKNESKLKMSEVRIDVDGAGKQAITIHIPVGSKVQSDSVLHEGVVYHKKGDLIADIDEPERENAWEEKDVRVATFGETDEDDVMETERLMGGSINVQEGEVQPVQARPLVRRLSLGRASLMYRMALLTILWAIIVIYSLVKGGEGRESLLGLECGMWSYWLVVVSIFPLMIGATALIAVRLLNEQLENAGSPREGEIEWNERTSKLYPLVCMGAGTAAGLLGIGGGMIKGPLLLEAGLQPQVAAATSSFMILFTSSATTAQFMVLGMLDQDYALWFTSVGFVSAFAGQKIIRLAIARYRKQAIITYIIAILIGLGAVLMGLAGVSKMLADGPGSFTSVCG